MGKTSSRTALDMGRSEQDDPGRLSNNLSTKDAVPADYELAKLFDPYDRPTKTYSQLLAERVPRKGGLAQLAAAEIAEDPHPTIAALRIPMPSGSKH